MANGVLGSMMAGLSLLYTLEDKVPKPSDPATWAVWYEGATLDRIVAVTFVDAGVYISTVFLGWDTLLGGEQPVCFETCYFAKDDSAPMARYATWEEAERGHAEVVGKVAWGNGIPIHRVFTLPREMLPAFLSGKVRP